MKSADLRILWIEKNMCNLLSSTDITDEILPKGRLALAFGAEEYEAKSLGNNVGTVWCGDGNIEISISDCLHIWLWSSDIFQRIRR